MLCHYVAFVGEDVPVPVGPLSGVKNPRVREDLGPRFASGASKRIGGAIGIHMPLDRVVHRADKLGLVHQGQQSLGLVERYKFGLHAHVAALGMDVF